MNPSKYYVFSTTQSYFPIYIPNKTIKDNIKDLPKRDIDPILYIRLLYTPTKANYNYLLFVSNLQTKLAMTNTKTNILNTINIHMKEKSTAIAFPYTNTMVITRKIFNR